MTAQRFFHLGGEAQVRRGRRALLRRVDGGFQQLVHAAALERRRLHHGAAQPGRQLGHIDLVAVLLHQVHHVQRHHHRQAQVEDLRRKVEVALEVCGVHEVDDRVGTAGALPARSCRIAQQVVARHDLLGRVRRERVDARQVRDGDVQSVRVGALLLLDGNARPVAHVLRGPGQVVEHRRLAAVRIAGKRYANSHVLPFPLRAARRFPRRAAVPFHPAFPSPEDSIFLCPTKLTVTNSIPKNKAAGPPMPARVFVVLQIGVMGWAKRAFAREPKPARQDGVPRKAAASTRFVGRRAGGDEPRRRPFLRAVGRQATKIFPASLLRSDSS